ncbi:phosphatidylserine decarboxylase [Clostridium hydrogeniformans]|uniref:phosphatidylserine decarboxylase n=1 Tax=Clostridium hydrogeniformans TaxID=349933 RepID=UPI000485128A|nr:phosphatidylserine decarboxylase [Clostridium hydrogeniformans]
MIKVYNRKTKNYDIEKVAGEKYLTWNYSSPMGMNLLELFIKRKFFSKIYGSYCDTKFSSKKISKFVSDLDIDMSIAQSKEEDFKSFNEFFIRKLKSDARPIDTTPGVLTSPADGRLSVFTNIDLQNIVQVKGFTYSLEELIGDEKIAKQYENGTCMVVRLCPTDYHRLHFIDDGVCSESREINGHYYSVNPIALEKVPKLFCQNKREWSILHSNNFDDVIVMEVGATCVGTIIQTYTPNSQVTKGDEKGYFKFGGSTTILFFKENTLKLDDDILEQARLGFETHILMGERIGVKAN